MSKLKIPPQSEVLYDDWTKHYRDEFPDWNIQSHPVISNPNHWDYGIRWDDDEKRFRPRETLYALQLFLKTWW